MKIILPLFCIVMALNCKAQQAEKFNLGFEDQKDESSLPDGWFMWGTYSLETDTQAHSGNTALKITSDEAGSAFGSVAYRIPAKYSGKTIKLEGYMKIKDVEGAAGLIMRIDGDGKTLAFDNMLKKEISGTIEWKKYSVTLDYPEYAESIFLGGILNGKGEAWFDDFVLTIDDQNVQTLEENVRELPIAKLDKEFDEGSNISFSELSAKKIDDLELLGRIWGFLKYHHPEVAAGNLNWDYELFRILPEYQNAQNEDDRNKVIIAWIDSLGKIEKCAACKPVDVNAFLKPDLEWIGQQEETLKEKLQMVYNSRSKGENYHLKFLPGVGNPEFKNENAYANMPYPDEGFRLLSLYRYWNIINYYFPYKHLMDKEWNTTLKEYIPVFLNAGNELKYEFAVLQIIGDIQDTHANLWGGADKINEWKGLNYPAVKLRFIEDKLVVYEYYRDDLKKETGLEIGDIITCINEQSIEELITENTKLYPASNTPTRLRNMADHILRSNSTETNIKYISGNSEQQKTLKLYPVEELNVFGPTGKKDEKSFRMLDDNIGYVNLEIIKDEDIPIIKKDFKDTKGMIIDIRNYPSSFVPFSMGSYFISSDTEFVKFTRGSLDNPGEFIFADTLNIPGENEAYKGKLVVLVNEITQSMAEYTAMALRAGENTTIIGSTTAGADGNISEILLPGGLRTIISGIGVYYPDGKETQRIGIVPDIEVKPTINGIRNSRDELVEKAIEVISSQ